MLFNFHSIVNFTVFIFLLISNFILLIREDTFYDIYLLKSTEGLPWWSGG